ncbi:hypothetical protein B7463_g8572, partial [Scytalidium lignicola]
MISPSCSQHFLGCYYATYVFPDANLSFDLHAQGYSGVPSVIPLNLSNFDEIYSPVRPTALNNTSALAERSDICAFFYGCYQQAADTATTAAIYLANTGASTCQAIYAASLNYWTANNYANLNSVLQNVVVGLAISIASTPIVNATFNSASTTTGGNDGCDVSNKSSTANYFASSLYDFCQAIQAAQSTEANTDYYAGRFNDDNGDVADGRRAITRNFISAQADNFGPSCSALGITWNRARALQRSLGHLISRSARLVLMP